MRESSQLKGRFSRLVAILVARTANRARNALFSKAVNFWDEKIPEYTSLEREAAAGKGW